MCVTRTLGSRVQVEAAVVFRAPVVLLGHRGRLWCVSCTCYARDSLRQLLRRPQSRDCACLDRGSVVDYAVDVDVSVLGELVELELDNSGGTSDRAGQGDVCGDGCGSVGKILRATEGATESFGFGPFVAATGHGAGGLAVIDETCAAGRGPGPRPVG